MPARSKHHLPIIIYSPVFNYWSLKDGNFFCGSSVVHVVMSHVYGLEEYSLPILLSILFCFVISVSPHVCFILVLILISMFLR